jgi:hypothetical protein
LRFDFDGFLGARIAARAGCALAYREGAEADQGDRVVLLQASIIASSARVAEALVMSADLAISSINSVLFTCASLLEIRAKNCAARIKRAGPPVCQAKMKQAPRGRLLGKPGETDLNA